MKPILTVLNNTGNTLLIPNNIQTGVFSYLSRDVGRVVQGFDMFVENSTDFPINARYTIGSIGTENCEIVTVGSITLPTQNVPSAIQVASGTPSINRHARGDIIQQIMYDQIIIEKSATINGTYASVATIPFQVSSTTTVYQDTAGITTTFYRIRFQNSVTSIVSSDSESVSFSSFPLDSAGGLINSVLTLAGIKDDTRITSAFMLEALNEARRIYHSLMTFGESKPHLANFEFPIKTLAGTNFVNLPTNIDFISTNRSLINVRFSNFTIGGTQLGYIDKKEWNSNTYWLVSSTATSSVSIAATTVVLDNTADFPATGSVQAQSENFLQAPMIFNYTGNNVNTNTLTGVTGVTRTIAAGSQITIPNNVAIPRFYTIYNNKIVFDRVIPLSLNGKNIYIDYYKKLPELMSLTEVLPENYYNIYKDYLKFAIKRRRDDTTPDSDPDYVKFLASVKNVKSSSYSGQQIRII